MRPSTISAPSASALAAVKTVWIQAPSRTPWTFTQVSSSTTPIPSSRCHETPISIASGCAVGWPNSANSASPGAGMCPSESQTSGVSDGHRTARNRAKATTTAAIVPVWITRKSVQPYRKPHSGESPSRR